MSNPLFMPWQGLPDAAGEAPDAPLNYLTPETIRLFAQSSTADDKSADIQKQLQQIAALRSEGPGTYRTGTAAMVGEGGKAIGKIMGAFKERGLREEKQGVDDMRQRAVEEYIDLLRGRAQGQPARPQQAQPRQPGGLPFLDDSQA